MGRKTASGRSAAYARERAVLFGLVEPAPRRVSALAAVRRLSLLIGAALLAMFGAPAAAAWAAGQTLTYSDATTLIRAIDTANNGAGGVDTITYSGTAPTTLTFGGSAPALPQINVPINLSGGGLVTLSEAGETGDLLDLNAGSPATGGSSGSTISGLTFSGAPGAGVGVGSSNDSLNADTFTLNGVGLNVAAGASNDTFNLLTITNNAGAGVLLNGGTDTLTKSLISGNGGDGVQVNGDGNQLTGNLIGTDSGGFSGNLNLNRGEGAKLGGSGNTITGGVVAGGNDTFTLDAGGAANHVEQASLIGDPAPLIGDGQSMTLSAGALTQPVGASPGYSVAISGGHANDTVTVQLFSASCAGDVAKLQWVSSSSGTDTLNANGSGTVTVPAPNGAPSMPVFLADGQSAGVNDLPDPCGSGGSSQPPPSGPSPPAPPPPPSSSLACPALPTMPSPAFAPSGGDPNTRWVQAVFHDLLGRAPGSAELATWINLLKLGMTREQVVLAIEQSGEYAQSLVSRVFGSYLHRTPSAADASYWAAQLSGGQTDEHFAANVLGSPEFFTDAGGAATGFVNGLYACLLGRTPGAGELQFGLGVLSGGGTDTQLAGTILGSHEYQNDLVHSWYLRFLRRAPDSAALSLVNYLGSGASDEQVIAAILGSAEYWHDFNSTTLKSVSVSPGGSIRLTLAQPATVTVQVFKLLNGGTRTLPAVQHIRARAEVATFKLPRLRHIGAVNFGQLKRGSHTVHWNRRVRGRRLAKGKYELILQVRQRGRLIDVSDAIPFSIR